MNIATFSIKRPILIFSVVIAMLITGMVSLGRLGLDLYPPIDFPCITVVTYYSGATPEEIEYQISKPLEDSINTIAGIKRITSRNMEGVSYIIIEFTYETGLQYADEQVREKVSLARNDLPDDLEREPVIKQFDPTDAPVITLALMADLAPNELYDLANEEIRTTLETVGGVGEIDISGGSRREIHVELDRAKLNRYELSALGVATSLRNSGANVSVGRYDTSKSSTVFRSVAEYESVAQVKRSVVFFAGDIANSVKVSDLGDVSDSAGDEKTRTLLYYTGTSGKASGGLFGGDRERAKKGRYRTCLVLDVYKQSGKNPVAIADGIRDKMVEVNRYMKTRGGNPELVYVYDTAHTIRANVDDVKVTIIIGIILAVVIVYLFLGNLRSTFITGLAIPNSLIGAFVLMYAMGFTLNLMTLMALSLTVGLLIDDAIVVRENIFRKLEDGVPARLAAEQGATEVMQAVVATTLTILAVFLPIGFLEGIAGRFFKQFGLTVVFAMCISLFDALAVAPILSAYFAGKGGKATNIMVRTFDRFQSWLESRFDAIARYGMANPKVILGVTLAVFLSSLGAFMLVKKTFMPDADQNEFAVSVQLPVESSLDNTYDTVKKIGERLVVTVPEIDHMMIKAGTDLDEHHLGRIGVFLVPRGDRSRGVIEIKKAVRAGLTKEFPAARPSVDTYSGPGGGAGGGKPFCINIKGRDLDTIQKYSAKLMEKLKRVSDLAEITSSYEAGSPEFQVNMDVEKLQSLGVDGKTAGTELRYHIQGAKVGKFHDSGIQYDVRLRLKEDQRDLAAGYADTRVPNIMIPPRMIPLSAVSDESENTGPSKIIRQDRMRVVQIFANLSPNGALGGAMSSTRRIIRNELPLPSGVDYAFVGQADTFTDMMSNMMLALALSVVFIYLVLASLYESFITPVTILIALPPALSGAFFSLFVTGKFLDIFSMIGIVMLLGLVTKNSILLVDHALENVRAGVDRAAAALAAVRMRLRPILMTAFAMLAGTLPVALGMGEAAKYRVGMGVSIIGGLIFSTLITLIVVPLLFVYVDRFREFVENRVGEGAQEAAPAADAVGEKPKPLRKKTSAKKK